jgi:hypothetical protein
MGGIRDMPSLLAALNYSSRHVNEQNLRQVIAAKFEAAKKHFCGTQSIMLEVSGLPNTSSPLIKRDMFVLSAEDMRKIYNPVLCGLQKMLLKAMRGQGEMRVRNPSVNARGQRFFLLAVEVQTLI